MSWKAGSEEHWTQNLREAKAAAAKKLRTHPASWHSQHDLTGADWFASMMDEDDEMAEEEADVAQESGTNAQCVLVFGGTDDSRHDVCVQLASKSGGTLVTATDLISHSERSSSPGSPRSGLVSFDDQLAAFATLMLMQPPPYVLDAIPRMPSQLPKLEKVMGPLLIAIAAPGSPDDEAKVKANSQYHSRLLDRVHWMNILDEPAFDAALAAMKAAGIVLNEPSTVEDESSTAAAANPPRLIPAKTASETDLWAAAAAAFQEENERAATKLQAVRRGVNARRSLVIQKVAKAEEEDDLWAAAAAAAQEERNAAQAAEEEAAAKVAKDEAAAKAIEQAAIEQAAIEQEAIEQAVIEQAAIEQAAIEQAAAKEAAAKEAAAKEEEARLAAEVKAFEDAAALAAEKAKLAAAAKGVKEAAEQKAAEEMAAAKATEDDATAKAADDAAAAAAAKSTVDKTAAAAANKARLAVERTTMPTMMRNLSHGGFSMELSSPREPPAAAAQAAVGSSAPTEERWPLNVLLRSEKAEAAGPPVEAKSMEEPPQMLDSVAASKAAEESVAIKATKADNARIKARVAVERAEKARVEKKRTAALLQQLGSQTDEVDQAAINLLKADIERLQHLVDKSMLRLQNAGGEGAAAGGGAGRGNSPGRGSRSARQANGNALGDPKPRRRSPRRRPHTPKQTFFPSLHPSLPPTLSPVPTVSAERFYGVMGGFKEFQLPPTNSSPGLSVEIPRMKLLS